MVFYAFTNKKNLNPFLPKTYSTFACPVQLLFIASRLHHNEFSPSIRIFPDWRNILSSVGVIVILILAEFAQIVKI